MPGGEKLGGKGHGGGRLPAADGEQGGQSFSPGSVMVEVVVMTGAGRDGAGSGGGAGDVAATAAAVLLVTGRGCRCVAEVAVGPLSRDGSGFGGAALLLLERGRGGGGGRGAGGGDGCRSWLSRLPAGGSCGESASQAMIVASVCWRVSSFSLLPRFRLAHMDATRNGPAQFGSSKFVSLFTSLSIDSL